MTSKQKQIFRELRLAMKAGQYSNLSSKEKLIYKNAFKNGYKLAQKHVKKIKESIGDLKVFWREGDMNAMEATSMKEFEASFPDVFNTLLTERNQNWLPMLTTMMNSPETEFVLVGTMHLAGDKSVLALLAEQGYHIEQLN